MEPCEVAAIQATSTERELRSCGFVHVPPPFFDATKVTFSFVPLTV